MGPGKALIVDDAEMNAALLAELIAAFDIPSDIAYDGKEALDFLRENKYSIVFMDHLMPVMDGMEAMAVIKKDDLAGGAPVIMITANDAVSDKNMYFEAGFSDYMKKPFSGEEIKHMLIKYNVIKDETEDEWKTFSERFKFIETEGPKRYCLQDTSLYIQLLREYAKSDILVRLERALEDEENGEVRYLLRNIKNNARLVGAIELANKAHDAEKLFDDSFGEEFLESCEVLKKAQKKIFSRLTKAAL
ncbi:MAG: response regulator [Butyrivibrio sp.]|nr:response regulator [Butyrivibrio sp.]